MKINWNNRSTTRAVYAAIVVMVGILFYSWLANFTTVNSTIDGIIAPIKPIIAGMLLAYLLAPVLDSVEGFLHRHLTGYGKMRHRRMLSMVITYVLVLLVLTIFLILVVPQVIGSIKSVTMQLKTYIEAVEAWSNTLVERLPEDLFPDDIAERISTLASTMITQLFSFLNASLPLLASSIVSVGSSVINLFVAFIASIYVLAEKERFCAQAKKVTYALFSRTQAENCLEVVRTADRMFGHFITGKIIDSLIIGILCFIGVTVLRMPNTILVSFIVGVTNVIPYFGPFIGAIPSFFLIFIESPIQGLIFLVFVFVLQQLDGNVIGPKILGDTTGLSSFWILFAIMFFGGVFGVTGMIIGVPLLGVIYWAAKIHIANSLAKKGLPIETEAYMKKNVTGEPEEEEKPEA